MGICKAAARLWECYVVWRQSRRRDRIKIEEDYYSLVTKMAEPAAVKQALRLGDILNTKASALLTHVSIMIAVSAALYSLQKPPNEERLIKMP